MHIGRFIAGGESFFKPPLALQRVPLSPTPKPCLSASVGGRGGASGVAEEHRGDREADKKRLDTSAYAKSFHSVAPHSGTQLSLYYSEIKHQQTNAETVGFSAQCD